MELAVTAERNKRFPTQGATADLLHRAIAARILERFAPAHVVVDRDGDIVHFSAHTGRYFRIPRGMPTRQLAALARPALRPVLIEALRDAVTSGRAAVRRHVALDEAGDGARLTVTVEPLPRSGEEVLYLVVFGENGRASEGASEPPRGSREIVDLLEHELSDARWRLQATIEEYDLALEELKAANEELLVANSEMQAANEEIELSREQLGATNAELIETNVTLNRKVKELDRACADLQNLFEGTRIAAVFLDREQAIRDFTRSAARIFRLIDSDRGRPLADIANRLDGIDLRSEIEGVLATDSPVDRVVGSTAAGEQYLMQLLPYRVADGATDGVLATFINLAGIAAEGRQ
jgi:two-component system CheB/CheR fusion protein